MASLTGAESLDEALQRFRAGDSAGYTAVYRQLGRPLFGTALRMLGRREDAEDAVQEAFLALFRRGPDLPGSQLGAWMHRVLVNHCIDRLRRRQRWQEQEVFETTTPRPARQDGPHVDLQRAVARLPEQARLVFVLHDVEGFKHREIAEQLGIKEGTTKSQLFRAREMLRGFLEQGSGPSSR